MEMHRSPEVQELNNGGKISSDVGRKNNGVSIALNQIEKAARANP